MFLELIATFAAGFGAAGLMLLLGKLSGGRLPRWAMPVAAGLAMIGYTIWSEYSWAARTRAELPDEMVVLREIEQQAFWKPWTYLAPQVARLVVLDIASIQHKPDAPGVRLVELYLFGRWQRPARIPQLIDCDAGARADVSDAALEDPSAARWTPLDATDPMIARVCAAELGE